MKRIAAHVTILALTLALAPLGSATAGEPAHFEKGGHLTEPVAVHKVQPAYPESARDAKTEGTVVLDALIRTDGSVDRVKILESAGDELDSAATAAAKQWRFEPARDKDGNPVAVYYTLTFRFRLR